MFKMSNIQKIAPLVESGEKTNLELAYNLLLAFTPKERYKFLVDLYNDLENIKIKLTERNHSDGASIKEMLSKKSNLNKGLHHINEKFINSRYTLNEYTTLLIKEAAWDKKSHLKSVEHTVDKVYRFAVDKPLLRAYISYVVDDISKGDLISLLRSIKTTTVLDIPLKMKKEDPKELLNLALEMYTPLEGKPLGGDVSKIVRLVLKLDDIIKWCENKING